MYCKYEEKAERDKLEQELQALGYKKFTDEMPELWADVVVVRTRLLEDDFDEEDEEIEDVQWYADTGEKYLYKVGEHMDPDTPVLFGGEHKNQVFDISLYDYWKEV